MWGVQVEFEEVQVALPSAEKPLLIERIWVKPSLIRSLMGSPGGTVWIEGGGGEIEISGTVRQNRVDVSIDVDDWDLGKTGMIKGLSGIDVEGILDGDVEISGDLNNPQSTSGEIDLKIKNLKLPAQAVMGFKISSTSVEMTRLRSKISEGVAVIDGVDIGDRAGRKDDLFGKVTGKITLGKQWIASTLDLRTEFGFSEKLLQELRAHFLFAAAEGYLEPGKRKDGTYGLKWTGSIFSPVPIPIPSDK